MQTLTRRQVRLREKRAHRRRKRGDRMAWELRRRRPAAPAPSWIQAIALGIWQGKRR